MSVSVDSSVSVTATGIPVRNLWHMLLYAWEETHLIDRWSAEVDSAPSLDALLASVLAGMVEQRIRIGLGRDYRDQDELLRGIRGRVDFTRTIRQMALQQGQVHCHFQIFDADVPKNRIIRSTLLKVAQVANFGPHRRRAKELRHRIGRLVQDLAQIQLIEVKPQTVRRQLESRDDRDYQIMLRICELLLRRLMPTRETGDQSLPDLDEDQMTIYQIFEKFVARFYRQNLKGWSVRPQQHFTWPATEPSAFLPIMKPDLVLKHRATQKLVILDTKFTAKSLTNRDRFQTSHLYQLYAYLRSQEHLGSEYQSATGVLLYPTVARELHEQVEIQGHKMFWQTIDLAKPWTQIEEDLIAIASVWLR